MYQPERYQKNSHEFAEKLIRQNPYGEFILQGDRLLATHIPILIDEDSDSFRYDKLVNQIKEEHDL